jgi:endonuclease YncB( thermonuclease family)
MKREAAIALAIGSFGVGLGAGVPVGVLLPSGAEPKQEITASTFEVLRVIDGDTFVVEYDGEPTGVRIAGIDTPERNEPGYAEATRMLRRLVKGERVELTFADPRTKRDDFGRLLAHVRVGETDVGEMLATRGWGVDR